MPEPPPRNPSVIEVITSRRSTRRFDANRALDENTLAQILHLATLAPSLDNLQHWRFVVVRSRRNRERLRGCALGRSEVIEAPVVVIVLGYLNAEKTDLDAILADQVRLGSLTPEEAAEARAVVPRSSRVGDPILRATASANRAAATLMIAAEGLGVASSPIDVFDVGRLRAAFGIADDHVPCLLIALGFAAENPPFPGRFGLDHVASGEHFGRPWTGP